MNILFAPSNIASFASTTMDALNKIEGISAKGFSLSRHPYWTFGQGWYIAREASWKNPFKKIFYSLQKTYRLLQLIWWADVVHWQWDIGGEIFLNLHCRLLKLLKKPMVVEWLGSDIRIPEQLAAENKFYKKYFEQGVYTYQFESRQKSEAVQKCFHRLGAMPALCPEMSLYLNKTLFPHYISLYQRVPLAEFDPQFPSLKNDLPLVVHTPSATGAKGTDDVRRVIENLKQKGLPFKYIEITNQSRQQALNAIRSADIYLDQFIAGSYGMACCEAMAMGKPVFCYLMPSVVEVLPENCPIVNANLDNLEEKLALFIADAALRNETGRLSRAYVEQYHDADKIARQLVAEYRSLISKQH